MEDNNLRAAYQRLAGTYHVPLSVIESLAKLIQHSHGAGIRFDIPELGGEGIWKPHQLAHIGNGFNHELNNRATELCNEINRLLQHEERREETTIVNDLDETTGFVPISIVPIAKTWWSPRYGSNPTLMGNAGGLRFAYFKEHNRLVIQNNLRNRIFDTSGFDVTDVIAGQRAGFFNTIIKTTETDIPITQLNEVAK